MLYSRDNVFTHDLERIVKREAFHWGDKVAASYFEPAAEGMEHQWAVVEPFLSQFSIDYSNTIDLACGRGRNSEKLANLAHSLTLVDVNEENISFCHGKFTDAKFSFIVNNGYDLREITDHSITFIYCLEAAVHFDVEIILSYIKEFRRVLIPGGFGFVHHSNFTKNPGADFRAHSAGRNFMSKELFAHLCIQNGLEIIEQRVLDWGGYEADCFSLFRNTAGWLRSVATRIEDAGKITMEEAAAPIHVFEPANQGTVNSRGYLLGNVDLWQAFGDDETRALQHFHEFGFKENRHQLTTQFLASRIPKFARFKTILPGCDAICFPVLFGRVSAGRNEAQGGHYLDPSKTECAFWKAELDSNPRKLYAEIGPGLSPTRRTVWPNCAYVDVIFSLTTDILIEPTYELPFRDASLDGIRCSALLDDAVGPSEIVKEFARVLKPGGRTFFGLRFLQQALFTNNFRINQLHGETLQGADHGITALVAKRK
jgi:ubiquinone/menaquinone biosynthesis C-methylase UbiE